MSSFVRASKYRHVYVDAPKATDTYSGIRLSTAVGEQNYIKGNPKFFSVALAGGGGPFTVIPYESKGPVPLKLPIFSGHKSDVLDTDFNPFHDHIIASASDDTTIKVWGIPEGGLKENVSDPLVDLRGHERKATLLRFHPTAMHLLGSAGADNTVKLWDVEKGQEVVQCAAAHEQLIQDLQWDYSGGTYATTSKDKALRVVDARTGSVALKKEAAHEGAKSSKCTFLGPLQQGMLLTVGFTKQSRRQIKVWDLRSMEREAKVLDIDQAAGVIMPFFDPDSNLLYLAGKGDGNIRFYELSSGAPFIFPISEYRSTTPCKGCALVPKRGLDVMKCETARLLKLTTSSVEPLSFIVPRKGDFFQEDLFPPTFAGVPSHSADAWLAGSDKPPKTISLDPAKRPIPSSSSGPGLPTANGHGGSSSGGGVGGRLPPRARLGGGGAGASGAKGSLQLQKELDAANLRISLLESRLKAAGLDYS